MEIHGWLILAICGIALAYLYKLSLRLQGSPSASPLRNQDLAHITHENIDVLESIPTKATHFGYAVVGGSGFLGTYLVRLLLLRGETNIRIVDLHPPSEDIRSHPSVSFIKADISSLQSIHDALTEPFATSGVPPKVIFHTAAAIRFWERLSYCWSASYKVNVVGTENVVTVAKELSSTILIYTSTADTAIPCPKFLRLGWDLPKHHKLLISDSDEPLPPQLCDSCYSRTKILAERRVADADGQGNLRTGIVRPGCTIIGPNDRLVTSTLTTPRNIVFDKNWRATNICVWDAAAAHLMLEDALAQNKEEARGQAFLVTGKDSAWSLNDTREAVKYFSTREIIVDDVSPLFVFLLAHFIEAFLFVRYHILLFTLISFGRRPRLIPRWLGLLVYLQPATLYYLNDISIDDSRARKVLGYRALWGTGQAIRYAVDEVQSGKTGTTHGLKLKAEYM